MSKLKTASVLAFERKVNNSDGLLSSGNWGDWDAFRSVTLTEKSVRGTISNRLKSTQDPAKELQKPNLQTVDAAALTHDSDTLKLAFTVRLIGDLASPSACNDPAYQTALSAKINGYIGDHGFTPLAQRYAENLANGRYLWRNRIGAEQLRVVVSCSKHHFEFDSYDFELNEFTQAEAVANLAALIAKGLAESQVLLRVEAFAQLGAGQEVYPSQELVIDDKSKKSRVLYHINNQAALHSQKIGNALRTIDTWYPQDQGDFGAIAVETYGSITSRGLVLRDKESKQNFYALLDNWVLKDAELTVDQQHYVIAVLIRGGVFGDAGK
jgi:CRISPR-associated protein Csy3